MILARLWYNFYMQKFEEKKFNIPALKGISAKTIEEHLKLYSGYVANANLVMEKIATLGADPANAYAVSEIRRRFSFEFNGMRNHEVYFSSFEGGAKPLPANSLLKQTVEAGGGTLEAGIAYFKSLALTRGIGWAMLWYDRKDKMILASWVDEQHLGQLQDCTPILALDMWEHSFVADYQPSGKKSYVEDFFANLNWEVIEKNFLNAR